MKTTRIAQYAAEAANISCRAALVRTESAALNNSVNTMRTPTALKVFFEVMAGLLPSISTVLVNLYIVTVEVSESIPRFYVELCHTNRNN